MSAIDAKVQNDGGVKWCVLHPFQAVVHTIKWLVGKVVEVAMRFFAWISGDPKKRVSEEWVWQMVAEQRRSRRQVAVIEPPEPSDFGSSDSIDFGEPIRAGLQIAEPRPDSPLEDLAALSLEALAEREELSPQMAHLFSFCLKTTLSLSDIIYQEVIRPSERSIQGSFINIGRWFERVMNDWIPGFSPVNVLFGQLLELGRVDGGALSESQLALIGRIREAGSPEELIRLFASQQPPPGEPTVQAYGRAVGLFFEMIANPGAPAGRQFWTDAVVPDILRRRILYDVLIQFVATPVAAFLQEMNHHFGERLPAVLLHSFHDNGLIVARTLFNRLRYLLEHDRLAFTALFDRVIGYASDQFSGLDSVEQRHQVLFEEAQRWREVDVGRRPGTNLIEQWRRALRYEIVVAIDTLDIKKQRPEQLLAYEKAIIAFNESHLREELEAEGSAELCGRIDAMLEAVRRALPADAARREALDARTGALPKPRILLQQLLYNRLSDEGVADLPEARGVALAPFIDAFCRHLVSLSYRREHPLPRRERDFGELARRLLALLLPEQPGGDGVPPVDGVTALINQLSLPDEFKQLFAFAVERLPGQIFGDFWTEPRQEAFVQWLNAPGGRPIKDGLWWLLIEVKVRPFITDLVTNGLRSVFRGLSSREGLLDLMALNVLPTVNDLLLMLLAQQTLSHYLSEAATLFQPGREPRELVHALEVWLLEKLRGLYSGEGRPGRLAWAADIDVERLRRPLQNHLRGFQERLEAEEGGLTAARFKALLTLHFNGPAAAAAQTPPVYGDLVEGAMRLGQVGATLERWIFPWFRSTVQQRVVAGLQAYRRDPDELIRKSLVSLEQIFSPAQLELLFHRSPEHLAAVEAPLRAELERTEPGSQRQRELTRRLARLADVRHRFAERAAEHAPERVHGEFERQVRLAARLGYELIDFMAGTMTPWYMGTGYFGQTISAQLMGSDASHLEAVFRRCFTRFTQHEQVNMEMMFNVFFSAIRTLQAVPPPPDEPPLAGRDVVVASGGSDEAAAGSA